MEKLYKLIVFFVGLTAMNLTVQAQMHPYAPYLASSYSKTSQNVYSNLLWTDILRPIRKKQTINFINYPNPASISTTVSYDLVAKSNVVLKVIDLAGKQLAVLVKQQQNAGKQEYFWEFSRNNITSGMYILILQVDNKSYSRKVIVQ